MFIKEDIENMLRDFKSNEAKRTESELQIEEIEEALCYAGTGYEESKDETIESMQLSSQAISDVPKSKTNKVSDKVFNTLINYEKNRRYINKIDREELKNQLKKLNNLKYDLDKKIVRVKNMLNQLSAEQRIVVETYYMERSKWDYVEKVYYEEFEIHKNIRQLQRYKEEALESMLKVVNLEMS